MGVGEKYSAHPLIGRGFLGHRASLEYDANDLSLKLEGFRPVASASYFLSPPTYTATHSTHCNTLRHAATCCNALRCNTLQHTQKILQRCLAFPLSPHINESESHI